MCGQLHCSPAQQLAAYQAMVYKRINSQISINGTSYECDSVIFDVGMEVTDPGLAPDGAKCADGKVLFTQPPMKRMCICFTGVFFWFFLLFPSATKKDNRSRERLNGRNLQKLTENPSLK